MIQFSVLVVDLKPVARCGSVIRSFLNHNFWDPRNHLRHRRLSQIPTKNLQQSKGQELVAFVEVTQDLQQVRPNKLTRPSSPNLSGFV